MQILERLSISLYTADIDIKDLITLDDACESLDLGPNGGLIYCMDFLLLNVSWLITSLKSSKTSIFIIDCPGQIEIFSQHPALAQVLSSLQSSLECKIVSVNLIDSHLCTQPCSFISACLVSLSIMTHLEIPALNVLSKIDLLGEFNSDLKFNLEFYTEARELARLVMHEEFKFNAKLRSITEKIAEVVEDFALVTFHLLSVTDKELMMALLKQIERALGNHWYYQEDFAEFVVSERVAAIEEKYCSHR